MKSTYEVENNFVDTNCTVLIEPYHNTEGSEYITEHMEKLSAFCHHLPEVDDSKADDLLSDVILSILNSEENGRGYTPLTDEHGNTINPEQWVISRIKLFAKNAKYKKGASDTHATTRKNFDGTVVGVQDVYTYSTFFCDETADGKGMTASRERLGDLDYMASGEDIFDAIDDVVSLRKSIDFCIDFNEVVGFNFLNLFKNIEAVGNMASSKEIFEKLRGAISYHDELRDALMVVMNVCMNNRPEFDRVIAAYACA